MDRSNGRYIEIGKKNHIEEKELMDINCRSDDAILNEQVSCMCQIFIKLTYFLVPKYNH